MSIRFTLIGLLVFLTAMIAHASYTSLRILGQNHDTILEYSDSIVPSLKVIAGISADIGRFRFLEAEHIIEQNQKNMNDKEFELDKVAESIGDYLVKVESVDTASQEIKDWQETGAIWKRYGELHRRLIELSHGNLDTDAVQLFAGEMRSVFDELARTLSNAIAREQLEATERISIAEQQYQTARSLLLAGLWLGLLVCVFATAYAAWGVSRPLTRLSRAMKRLVEGEDDVELPSFGPHNEIGQIAGAVQRFKVRATERAEILQEARRAAESASEAKANFIASMSHEIRTPLNGVLGMAQSLFADELLPEQRDKVSIILSSGSSLMALLNDVLDVSKINAGKMEVVPVDGDLRLTLMSLVHLFQPGADDKGAALTVTFDPAIPERLKFDPVRVRQCVGNLLSNAIKFSSRGGQIELRVGCVLRPEGSNLVDVSVSDTGIGMTPETMAKLFMVFTQADDSISRRFGGSGLGLAISRRLAQGMGGDIDVTSELGVGSCFRMTFMAAAAAPMLTAIKPKKICEATLLSSTAVLKGSRVLLVDDNAVNRQVIKLFLKPFDVNISEAANGKEALEKLSHAEFDVVLLDVHMPVMDGCETIQVIRASNEAWSSVPTLALTADAMSGDRERYLAMGMTDYLSKPIDQRELVSRMTSIIAQQRGSMTTATEAAGLDSDGLLRVAR
jgi:signal transduction histidine kinase/AmiR/NasT family two-component response regulator